AGCPGGRWRGDGPTVPARRADRRGAPGDPSGPARDRGASPRRHRSAIPGIRVREAGGGRARHPRLLAPATVMCRASSPAVSAAPKLWRRGAGTSWTAATAPIRRRCHSLALAPLLVLLPIHGAAQPVAKVARVGYLSPTSATADAVQSDAFRQGLRALGYVEGQSVLLEARYADGRPERLQELATELVRLKVDVIVAGPTTAIRAAQQATRTIPIVMAFAGDPVGEGFAAGLARPGGNITGHSAAVGEITAKRLQFLQALVPGLSRVVQLTTGEVARAVVTETEAAGRALGVRVTTTLVGSPSEVDRAFSSMRDARAGGIVVGLALRPYWTQILQL